MWPRSADLVLLEQDLNVLREGIAEGRRTFANTIRYIFTTTSANFGNMFSMAGVIPVSAVFAALGQPDSASTISCPMCRGWRLRAMRWTANGSSGRTAGTWPTSGIS
jgi:cation transport ATPase